MLEETKDSPGPLYWVGLDVSKATVDAGLASGGAQGGIPPLAALPAGAFPRSPAGAAALVQWVEAHAVVPGGQPRVRCVMEATGRYSTELAQWLLALRPAWAPAIAPPHQTAAFMKSLGVRNVTDKLAARCLAVYGMERQPAGYEPPSPPERELRELSRYRDGLVQQHTAAQNQAGEETTSAFVKRNRQKRIRLLDADIARTEARMRRVIARSAILARDVALLDSIYGVGFVTAAVVRAELGDLRRFARARQLSAFAGLNPSIRQSGSSVRGRTRLCKRGNVRVRQALYMAAMVAIQGDNDFQRTYHRLVASGKANMAALGTVMRKLLCVMRAILITEEPYHPHWKLGAQPHSRHTQMIEKKT